MTDKLPTVPGNSGVPHIKWHWDPQWDVETARLACEYAEAGRLFHERSWEGVEKKAVAVFGISSAIATLAPTLTSLRVWSGSWWLWMGAVLCWGASTYYTWQAFKPRTILRDPNSENLLKAEWLSLSPGAFYAKRIAHVAGAQQMLDSPLSEKGAALHRAFGFGIAEVFLAILALLARSW